MSDNTRIEFFYKELQVKPFPSSTRSKIICRPIIPLTILYKNRFVQFEALVDSGADYNIFHGDIAIYLGVKLSQGSKRHISGISGNPILGYEHSVSIKIGRNIFATTIIFSNQIPDNAIAVLGNQGFFDHFCVTFNYKTKTISIK